MVLRHSDIHQQDAAAKTAGDGWRDTDGFDSKQHFSLALGAVS